MFISDQVNKLRKKAIIKLKTPIDASICAELMEKTLRGQKVQVQEMTDGDLSAALTGGLPSKTGTELTTQDAEEPAGAKGKSGESSDDAEVALKLRGLPYQVTMEDIKHFFSGYNVVAGSIKIGLNPDGSKTGEGTVLFSSVDDARKAYKNLQNRNIGHRYIELYLTSFGEYSDFEKF